MKKDYLSFKISQPKHRAHRMLFDEDLPFKHRVENPKKGQYKRKPKHKKEMYNESLY